MPGFNITEDPAPEEPSADAPVVTDTPVDEVPVDEIPVEEAKPVSVSPREFAAVIDEGDLIAQLKDLQGQYEALTVPDPYQEERYAIVLKMQAIRERLMRI